MAWSLKPSVNSGQGCGSTSPGHVAYMSPMKEARDEAERLAGTVAVLGR
jgi:hypothetical protein